MTTTKKWRMLSTLMLTGVMSVWGQLCHADGSLTYTSAVIIDTHIRSDKTGTKNGTSENTEIYYNTSNGLEFVQLMNISIPQTPDGYTISNVNLRLVSKRAKGVARNGISIYDYPHTVTNDATWGSENSYIAQARESAAITTFEVAGKAGSDLIADNISSDYYDISKWTNTIDLSDYAKGKGGKSFNLMLSAAASQTNGDAVCFYTVDCADSYTNANSGQTYNKADLIPVLTVTYSPISAGDIIGKSTVVSEKTDVITSDGITITTDETLNKNVIKFTPLKTGEVGLSFNVSDHVINNSQNYFIIETNSGAISSSGNFKCRSLDLDNIHYEANTGDMKALYDISNSTRQLLILSPLGTAASTGILNKFHDTPDGTDIALNKATIYYAGNTTSEVTIYRAGLYNLGEILEMYPSLKVKNWQFVSANALRMEAYGENNNGTDNGTIRISNNNQDKSNYKVFKQQMRSLGTLPDNFTSANYYSFDLEEGITPTTEDLLTPIPGLQILFQRNLLKYFPTMTPKKVKADDGYYWAYKDGVPALKDNFYVLHTYVNKVIDFTRKFLHGYNSGILPFELDVTSLPEGWTAYVFRDYTTEGDLRFEKKDYTIAANTPFFIKVPDTATEGLYVISSTNTADPIDNPANYIPTDESNGARLVGSYINEVATNNYGTKKYGIDKSGQPMLMKSTTKTSYYRAFIAMGEQATSAKSIVFDNNTITGINDISALNDNGQTANDDAVYDLSGRKVADNYTLGIKHHALPKGIYIHKGKKIVMK